MNDHLTEQNANSGVPSEADSSSTNANGQSLAGTKLDFPWKLHRMLNDVEQRGASAIISWLPDGRAFKVHDKDKFVKEIIPLYFHSTKYKSFQRSLNQWGFESIRQGPADIKGATFNQYFVRDIPNLCGLIVRKVPTRPSRANATKSNQDVQKQKLGGSSPSPQESGRGGPQTPSGSGPNDTCLPRKEKKEEESADDRSIPSSVTVPKHPMPQATTPLATSADEGTQPRLALHQQNTHMTQLTATAGHQEQIALAAWISQQQQQQQQQLQPLSDLMALMQQQEQEATWRTCLERAALEMEYTQLRSGAGGLRLAHNGSVGAPRPAQPFPPNSAASTNLQSTLLALRQRGLGPFL